MVQPTSQANLHEDAWRAVQRFKQMEPTLVGFARAVTGNTKVRIKPTSSEGSSSTRDEISLHLPIKFGTNRNHDTRLCHDRGPDMQQLCPACAVMEDIQYDFYHECSHIGLGSHEEIDRAQVIHMANTVYETWSGKFPKFAEATVKKIRTTPIDPTAGPMQVATLVHDWLPFTFNVTEDLRVDTRMFDIRPGLRDIAEATAMRIMRDGMMFEDGKRFWKDAPLERQILVAIIFHHLGYGTDYFSDECREFIATDPEVAEFGRLAVEAKDVIDAFDVACELLFYLHTLGMYDPPVEEDEQDEDPGNESDQQEQSNEPHESESGEGGGGDGEDEGSPDEEEGEGGGSGEDSADGDKSGDGVSPDGDDDGESDSEGGEQGRGDIDHDHEVPDRPDADGDGNASSLPDPAKLLEAMARQGGIGDPSEFDQVIEQELIDNAIEQAMHFDSSSLRVGGVRVHEYDTNHTAELFPLYAWGNQRLMRADPVHIDAVRPSESLIGSTLSKARRVFSDNVAVKRERNKKSGRINARSLAKRAPFEDPRMFEKKDRPNRKKYYVQVMIDVSGSNKTGGRIRQARAMTGAIGELLRRLGVEFEVMAHTADYMKPTGDMFGNYGSQLALDLFPVKKQNEPWNDATYERIQNMQPSQGNIDGHALEWARKRCDAQPPGTHSIILYETDGAMPATNGVEEQEILEREIKTCKSKGYTLLGVGIDTDSPRQYGLDTVVVSDSRDIVTVIRALESKLARV